jgi:hypothetical protein
MTTIDLRTRPSQTSAAEADPVEPFTPALPQAPQFEISTQLWMLMCLAGALILVSTVVLFVYGQGSVGI